MRNKKKKISNDTTNERIIKSFMYRTLYILYYYYFGFCLAILYLFKMNNDEIRRTIS